MIELKNDGLVFRFPEVHPDAVCRVTFQRTLRIPDDNREYPLPAGLGEFPLVHVEDHAKRLPASWSEHGGVLLPMYQAEALWIKFEGEADYPFAIKVATGKINAVTGQKWANELSHSPQDYLVVPEQSWLDGFCVKEGLIRQFVAMPLGLGYTAEEQISGTAEHGGIQIIVYPMKRARNEKVAFEKKYVVQGQDFVCEEGAMGLSAGGLMWQEIYDDPYGYDAWDLSQSSRCFVHILNSTQWLTATGMPAPGLPPTAADYTAAGLPWFDYYNDTCAPLSGSAVLAGLHSVAAKAATQGHSALIENATVNPKNVQLLGKKPPGVSEGNW